MRSPAEVEQVLRLGAEGRNISQISREIGVNRRTVSDWVRGHTRIRRPAESYADPRSRRGRTCARCGSLQHPAPSLVIYSYAYLLGLYLGDGCLLKHPRGVYRLHITLDAAHPVIATSARQQWRS